jgi:hypothetical protein
MSVGLLVVAALSVLASASAASATEPIPAFLGYTGPVTVGTGSPMTFERGGYESNSCSTVSATGAITGKKAGNLTLTFAGCGTPPNYCHGKGMKPSEFKTVELEMIPVYAVKTAGVAIELRPKVGTKFAELESPFGSRCELKGSVLAMVTPINRYSREFTLTFNGSKGRQTPEQYETESHEIVNSWLELESQKESLYGTPKMKSTYEMEIRG